MISLKKVFFALSVLFLVAVNMSTGWALSVPGPESDQHNTVYSYNISEVSLDTQHKQLHVKMTVHMCPYCSPYNNYVKVTIAGLGSKYVYNTPVGTTYTYTFTFDASSLKVGDIVEISSVVWCEWCGYWYDSAKYKVEQRIVQAPGLGYKCEMTLVRIGSSVNVANGNLYDSHQVSTDPALPLTLSYNSQSSQSSRFGFGWNDSVDVRLIAKTDGTAIFVDADGREEVFTSNADGSFASPPGNHDTLTLHDAILFSDDMENGSGQWTADSPWGLTTSSYHSQSTSWTDSPNGYYANSIHTALTMPLDLSAAGKATMTFWHRFVLESYYDYGYVEISKDGGANWTLLKSYTGSQNSWAEQTVSLDAYAGSANLLLRFRLITDSSVTYDGWYIDDVQIGGAGGYLLQRKDGTVITFDSTGAPTQIVDRNGNAATYGYSGGNLSTIATSNGHSLQLTTDSGGLVTGIADASSRSFAFSYDASGNLASITDAEGGTWSFSYDADHNLTGKTDPIGQVTQYSYDDQDRLISATDAEAKINTITYAGASDTTIADPAGNVTQFTFNGNLNVTKKIDAEGNTTEYGWDADMNKTSIRDSSGEISYGYDGSGNLLSKTDQAGNTWTYTYDSYGNVLTKADPDGGITTNLYDDKGNLISTTGPSGTAVQYEYDEYGRVTSAKDAGGRTTTYAYDDSGNLVSITDPAGFTTTMAYDTAGNMISRTDANGATTSYEYDSLNRLIKVTDPAGNVTSYTYDKNGNRSGMTDANGNITLFEYNQRGKVVKMTDALGNVTGYGYAYGGCSSCGSNGGDLLASVTDPNGHTVLYEYDSLGRRIKAIDQTGKSTFFTYDAKGNLLTRTDANGHVSAFTYDGLSRPVEMIDPMQGKATLSYDARGLTTTVSDANGNSTLYEYDATGRLVRVISPDAGTTSYAYGADGSLTTKTDANGTVISFSYDEAGRLAAVQFPDSAENVAYAYDTCVNGKGRLCSMTDPAGTTAYAYDKLGRIASETKTALGVTYATSYEYDKVGNLKSIVYPGGRKVGYTYNKLNKPDAVHAQLKSTETLATGFAYDPAGNLTSLTLGNGLIQSWSYDAANRVAGISAPGILSLDYTYDSAGNITSIVDKLKSDFSKTYTYDALDRLTGAAGYWGTLAWSYDANGNRLSQTGAESYAYSYTANRLEGVTGGQTMVYRHDNGGNIINDGVRDFAYNQNNRLIKALESGKILGEYTYNGSGQRIIKKTGPAASNSASGQNTVYHYDLTGKLIEETAGDGKLFVDYVYVGAAPLAMVRKQANGEETFYYHNDHLATPKVMTDKLKKVVWNIEFDPFGNEAADQGRQNSIRNVENNLRFAGQYFDAETGLSYNGQRTYDSGLGRYLEADPLGLGGGSNPYLYVKANPVVFTDRTGTNPLVDTARYLWSKVIDMVLIPRGWTLAADFLRNSLQDNPGSINTSLAMSKIRNSQEYKAQVNGIISGAADGPIPSTSSSIQWTSGDLFAAIGRATFEYDGIKCMPEWLLNIKIADTYDFHFLASNYYTLNIDGILATIANNMAWSDQFFGVITPYQWDVQFTEVSQSWP